MPEPANADEYATRFTANTRITGFFDKVTTHLPCPWCAEPDFQLLRIVSTEEDMQREATCSACGRSGKSILTRHQPGSVSFEFVQTGGPDAPKWLTPAPRRIAA